MEREMIYGKLIKSLVIDGVKGKREKRYTYQVEGLQ